MADGVSRPWLLADPQAREPGPRPEPELADPLCRMTLRPRAELGETDGPGVTGRHHFCFAAFQHPDHISWGALRAVHHYQFAPWAERPQTFHAGFEIVTIVLAGRWKRTGSLPATVPLGPNEAELVSSGIGAQLGAAVTGGGDVGLIEIWVESRKPHAQPRRQWLARRRTSLARPIAAGAPAPTDALMWDSPARLHYGWLEKGERLRKVLDPGEKGYLVIADGAVSVNGAIAQAGDGAAAAGPGRLDLFAMERTRLVWLRGL